MQGCVPQVRQLSDQPRRELVESGKVTPVIDMTFPLAEVPEAIRYLEEGHAQGKVIITI